MATEQLQQTISKQQSLVLVRNMMRTAISSIAYLVRARI